MGDAEAVGIFEAVAKGAVDADMGRPDQADRQDQGIMPEDAPCDARERQAIPVREIVKRSADLAPAKVA